MPLANAGQRLAASLIDYVLLTLYIVFMNYVLGLFAVANPFEDFSIPSLIFIYLPFTFYIPLMEYYWSGQTLGKFLLKLRVLKFDGTAASLGDITLRWLMRAFDLRLGLLFIFIIPRNPVGELEIILTYLFRFLLIFPFPLIGLVSMIVTKHNQRLGDIVANTIVVRRKRFVALEDTILRNVGENYVPTFTNVLALSDKDIYIIKNVLERGKNSNDAKPVIALAEKAKRILELESKLAPMILLHTIVKDYNYLAKQKDDVA